MKIKVPAKVILSGEHAVVYGQPALAMAVNRHITTQVMTSEKATITFDLMSLSQQLSFQLDTLKSFHQQVKNNYHAYLLGNIAIKQILKNPIELLLYACTTFFEVHNIDLQEGLHIQMHSTIPIAAGMGSSSAAILGILAALANHFEQDISQETLFDLALQVENIQHGKSSGLDLRVALSGGCILKQGDHIESRETSALPFYLIHTGTPHATTGECVQHAAKYFRQSSLANAFKAVTMRIATALQTRTWTTLIDSMRENHALLTHIEVVPKRVQQFIKTLERHYAAAKICGAGSISGDNGGIVLVFAKDESIVTTHAAQFGYELIKVTGEARGLHAV